MEKTYAQTVHQENDWIQDWFKDHKATLAHYLNDDKPLPRQIDRLHWAKPGTGFYHINYLIDGPCLFVTGDLGDAVYRWSENLSWKFLAGLDLDYFDGKCLASSEEPKGKSWYQEQVHDWIEYRLREWAENNPAVDDINDLGVPRPPLTFEECKNLIWEEDRVDLDEVIGHSQAWAHYISESKGLIVWKLLAPDAERYPREKFECCDEYGIGWDWNIRTRAHLEGLKMAYKQLAGGSYVSRTTVQAG